MPGRHPALPCPLAARGLELDPGHAVSRERAAARIRMPYGDEGWGVTRYEDVRVVPAGPRFGLARVPHRLPGRRPAVPRSELRGKQDAVVSGLRTLPVVR